MVYNLETMEEVDLLQAILKIDECMYEHFVDKDGIHERLGKLAKNKERGRLLQILGEAGLSLDEVVSILSSSSTQESSVPFVPDAQQGVKIVNVSNSQRQIIEANLKREEEARRKKMQVLLDKYNTES